MAGAGFFVDQFNLTEDELTKVSKFISAINIIRAKSDKPSMQPDEACKFMLATNFDVNFAVDMARNYEKYYTDYEIATVSNNTKQIETVWYNRKIWHTERRDKDGAAIIYFEGGLTDVGKDHKSLVQTLFLSLQDAAKSAKTQRNGIVVLMDLHDATLTSIDHGLMRLIFKIVLEGFPLFVKVMYLIEVPLWFKWKQKVVDHFTSVQVRNKIKLVSRAELTKLLPAQSMPSTLGGSGDSSLQNLSWLNVDEGPGKRVPLLPRNSMKSATPAGSKAHPFAATGAAATVVKTDSPSPRSPPNVRPDRAPKVGPQIPPPFRAHKQSQQSSNGIASKSVANRISNWERKGTSQQPLKDKSSHDADVVSKPVSDKTNNVAASNGGVAQMAGGFTQLTPSDSLKIVWRPDSIASNSGVDYVSNWLPTPLPQYENVAFDKPKPKISDHKPFSVNKALLEQTKPGISHLKPSTSSSSGVYEAMEYSKVDAAPVKHPAPYRRPKIMPDSSKDSKSSHTYVNIEIPSDPEPQLPPPIPTKKKVPVKLAVTNEQSDDSELDEEAGNEMQYENWSFLNVKEGDKDLTIPELELYIKSRKLQGLKAEYFKIRNKPDPSEMKICSLPCNSKKNRYRDVGCLDRNRVKLNKIHGKEGSDYVHANYTDGYKTPKEFILTQGPLKATVNDFWRMVWEQKSLVIVMLTRCMELNRWKCSSYWPDDGSAVYGEINVELLQCEEVNSFTFRTLRVHHVGDEATKHIINHFQFTTWPDYGVPSSGMDILLLVQSVKDRQAALLAKCPASLSAQFPPHGPPIVVHCSAGVGRTGTYCTVDYCIQQLLNSKKVNIQACVKSLRAQRAYAIQTEDQYHFCFKCVLEFAKNCA